MGLTGQVRAIMWAMFILGVVFGALGAVAVMNKLAN